MGQLIIQPSRVRRTFNGWCHGLFAGQRFLHVLNLGCGHDQDRQGSAYSGYFDAIKVTRMDKEANTMYPPEEACLHGGESYKNPVDVIGDIHNLPFPDSVSFDMVFCNWVIYHCNHRQALREIHRVLVPNGKLLVTYMDSIKQGKIYCEIISLFNVISFCGLQMNQELDGRNWIAEGVWGCKK